jgi:hypothetical protein
MRLLIPFIAVVIACPAVAQEVVPWKTLAQVQMTKTKDGFAPQFADSVALLHQKEVKIQGFMLPLESGEKHVLFILSAVPPTCSFCMPAGPDAVVEVHAKRGLPYTDNAVTLKGKLSVLKSDPTGIFYCLTEALSTK